MHVAAVGSRSREPAASTLPLIWMHSCGSRYLRPGMHSRKKCNKALCWCYEAGSTQRTRSGEQAAASKLVQAVTKNSRLYFEDARLHAKHDAAYNQQT